jgi:hypothetical protein
MMRSNLITPAALLLLLGACATPVVQTGPQSGVQPGPPLASANLVPAGTVLNLQLNQPLSTATNQVGDRFTATVVEPLVAADGRVAIPSGATVTGVVTGLSTGRQAIEPAAIRLDFERIAFLNASYPFEAEIVETDARTVHRQRQLLEHAAVGAALGAVIGGVVGGGLREALIGGALGAGAGTIISLGWGEVDAELPAQTTMTVRTTQAVSLR